MNLGLIVNLTQSCVLFHVKNSFMYIFAFFSFIILMNTVQSIRPGGLSQPKPIDPKVEEITKSLRENVEKHHELQGVQISRYEPIEYASQVSTSKAISGSLILFSKG